MHKTSKIEQLLFCMQVSMHYTTLVVYAGQIFDAAELLPGPLPLLPHATAAAPPLFVTVTQSEDAAFHLAYTGVVAYALTLSTDRQPIGVDLRHPLTTLPPTAQTTLRAWLYEASWGAWARAPQHVRALLGQGAAPVLLAEAARQSGIPLPTLANAAGTDRLPTIRVGDRHLIYLATVGEAQERQLLHHQRGRPHRGSKP
jgi:hypothetical protein